MTLRPKTIATIFMNAAILSFGAAPLFAAGYSPYSVTVLVDGVVAPEYASRGRIYIEALKGRNFSLLLSNPTSERVAVALSVDGRNVIDAKRTSASAAAKWILMPGQSAEIPGWQVSRDISRRFFFTETGRSYAEWLGDTANVGTIEAVFYRERERDRRPIAVAPNPPPPVGRPWYGRDSQKDESEGQVSPRDQKSASDTVPAAPDSPAPAVESGAAVSPKASPAPSARARESDSFAATGIGQRTSFSVNWIQFDEDPTPAARVALRYEFRPELVRLGVLRSESDLYARDRGRGFEREYAPDPHRDR